MGVKNFFVNEKAIIEILDLRELDDVVKKNVPASDGAPGGLASLTDNAFGNLDNTTAAMFPGVIGDAISNVLNGNKNIDKLDLSEASMAGVKKTFEVQFNPSDIHVEGYGGGRIETTAFNKGDSKSKDISGNISYEPAPVRINFSVRLLFDRMEPTDCFLNAKTNIAASDFVKAGARKALSKVNRKLSVQQEVEGLIAALRSPYTRTITFYWGNMLYCGVLNRVSSQYTMFNSAGEPVRAYVQLSLICADAEVSPSSMGNWEDAYMNAFGGGSKSGVAFGQKAGSILNLSK
ncbi:MAG: hypothetical protein J6B28_02725 [Eubacterium sp.]|nr:hypothetical protein [Eubacterium sp.]